MNDESGKRKQKADDAIPQDEALYTLRGGDGCVLIRQRQRSWLRKIYQLALMRLLLWWCYWLPQPAEASSCSYYCLC
jgi:hypothetical protein